MLADMSRTKTPSRGILITGASRGIGAAAALCGVAPTLYAAQDATDELSEVVVTGSRLAPWIWSAAAAYPAVVGLLRMEGGMHHFRDVATGYLVGAAIGYGVPALHEKRSKKRATTPIY